MTKSCDYGFIQIDHCIEILTGKDCVLRLGDKVANFGFTTSLHSKTSQSVFAALKSSSILFRFASAHRWKSSKHSDSNYHTSCV